MSKKIKNLITFFLLFYTQGCNEKTNDNNTEIVFNDNCNEFSFYKSKEGSLKIDESKICEFDDELKLEKIYYISRRRCLQDIIRPSYCIYSIEYYEWLANGYIVCSSVWLENRYIQLPCKKFR